MTIGGRLNPSTQQSLPGLFAPDPIPSETLGDARDRLMGMLDEGARCPCCDKFARRYRRRFNSTMTRSLIWLVREWQDSGRGWVDVPKIAPRSIVRSNQLPTVRWWGLAERPANTDDPRLKHSGLWRPTESGIEFALRRAKIPPIAVTYDGTVERLEGRPVGVDETLGVKFNYAEIMSGAAQ